ncbi:hypothetical protein PLESTM_000679900 [Pleodorina starrii]|nr:hypothetical protein PLESTM_000679900 [Pleodorina starrii]
MFRTGARDQSIRESSDELHTLRQELSRKDAAIADLTQKARTLDQQLQQFQRRMSPLSSSSSSSSSPSASSSSPSSTCDPQPCSSRPSRRQPDREHLQLKAAWARKAIEAEDLREELERVARQQQLVAQESTQLVREKTEELHRMAAEVGPLRRRVAEAESAAGELAQQAAEAEREAEAARGQVAALQARVAVAEKTAAAAGASVKTCALDLGILTRKYDKLVAEKVVLEELYGTLRSRCGLDIQLVGRAVAAADVEMRNLEQRVKEQWQRHRPQLKQQMAAKWAVVVV